ncbi:tryptophan synthase subunit alpha [Spirosoma utsteinense]|uniref:Tryptophan synthase alpha chain n=1 Tax=Spirosoma utsteinense TaxID=2585773 RepID=A0ABR6W0S0_9BACT|nr:tryptophan synthase subunit alpha [Spirosoma utsteinense]MBC3783643.1 tryptophan synthase alpha chain [Spirosoma utsteinense]MBC3790214.1 tryptophan synthase alpha chain [Spirosoma utsteinense]
MIEQPVIDIPTETHGTTSNRIKSLFARKSERLLNIYFTAGFPHLDDTVAILRGLQQAGVDLVEIGMPYSDPVADGETIQKSNGRALDNGMSLKKLFDQLAACRTDSTGEPITVPILLMGYINPVLQYGVENFCRMCREVGVDGVILPDLPLDLFLDEYASTFREYGILNVNLITPQTTDERIRLIDQESEGFIYMVSSASITGSVTGISDPMRAYFERIQAMNLRNPRLIGFGINNHETFDSACANANGAIVGSAFIRHLDDHGTSPESIQAFVETIRA